MEKRKKNSAKAIEKIILIGKNMKMKIRPKSIKIDGAIKKSATTVNSKKDSNAEEKRKSKLG